MEYNLLIRGGTVVDGTGAPARKADVRIAKGLITEVGADLKAGPRERVVDASGCYVTPGFIELHNHFDAHMWWTPTLDPMPGYGVTTSINGNCGFSAAPISNDPAAQLEMVKIFSFFEDIPVPPFLKVLPWDWRKWSEYRRSFESNCKFPVNIAFYVGHIAIRLAVMGLEAWDRAATPSEIAAMAGLLEDALSAGAVGLSTNMLDYDPQNRAVPSIVADDAEFEALLDVLARYPAANMQVIIGIFRNYTAVADMDRLERLCVPRNIRLQWVGLPTYRSQAHLVPALRERHERYKANGYPFWTGYHHLPATNTLGFFSTLIFASSNNYVWNEVITAPTEEAKLALLADPAWRERAREGWDGSLPQSPFAHASSFTFMESESGFGPIGVTLAEYMTSSGAEHPSDALAEWLLNNGVRSVVLLRVNPRDRNLLLELMRDPQAIGNLSDAGAHGQMLCGVGDNINLLTDFVRDTHDLTIEEGVHNLTGKLAGFFNLFDRGEIKVGKRADIAVFDLASIERRPTERAYDVPDGEGGRTWRYSRAPAPMLLTLVNGTPTFDGGRFTGLFPGEVVSPSLQPLAQAAE